MGQLTPIEEFRDLENRVKALEGKDNTAVRDNGVFIAPGSSRAYKESDDYSDPHDLTSSQYEWFCDRLDALEAATAKTSDVRPLTTDEYVAIWHAINTQDEATEGERRLTEVEYRRVCDRLAVLEAANGVATLTVGQRLGENGGENGGPDIGRILKIALDEWDEEKADKAEDLVVHKSEIDRLQSALADRRMELSAQDETIIALRQQIAHFENTLGGKTCKRLLKACEIYGIEPCEDVTGSVLQELHRLHDKVAALCREKDNLREVAPIVGLTPQIEKTLRQAAANETALLKACEELGIETGEDVAEAVIRVLHSLSESGNREYKNSADLRAENEVLVTKVKGAEERAAIVLEARQRILDKNAELREKLADTVKEYAEIDSERLGVIEERNSLERRLGAANTERIEVRKKVRNLNEQCDDLKAESGELRKANNVYETAYDDIVSLVRNELTPERMREIEEKHDLKATVGPE